MSLELQLGELKGKVDAMESDLSELKADVKAIRSAVDQAKGSWKFLLGLATLSSALGGAVVWVVSHLGGRG
jgi:hypothetical protein